MHDVVAVSRDVNDEVLTSEIIVIGTVVDDDSAGHDSLEARGPSLHSLPLPAAIVSSLPTLTAMSVKCYLLNISDLTQCSLIVQFISK